MTETAKKAAAIRARQEAVDDPVGTLARAHTAAAIAALVEVMLDAEAAPMARNAAANAVLQWGHGRPGGPPERGKAENKKEENVVIICWKPEQTENNT